MIGTFASGASKASARSSVFARIPRFQTIAFDIAVHEAQQREILNDFVIQADLGQHFGIVLVEAAIGDRLVPIDSLTEADDVARAAFPRDDAHACLSLSRRGTIATSKAPLR